MDLPEGQFMFPLALRQAGYYTAYLVSGIWGRRRVRPLIC